MWLTNRTTNSNQQQNEPHSHGGHSQQATLKWAQRKEFVYIKIDLQDVKDASIDVTPEGQFKFSGRVTQAKQERVYTADVKLFANLDIAVR